MTDPQDEPHAILAMRVDHLPVPHIKGSVKRKCEDCEAEVWVSPATSESAASLAEGRPIIILCVRCGFARIRTAGPSSLEMTREQFREMRTSLEEQEDGK